VLHLGCGLDTRFFRVDNGQVEWYDLDMPEVIALRRRFFAETGRYRMIPSSVTDLSWIDAVPSQPEPVLIIAEGLLMYLTEAQVKALVLSLKERFPGAGLAFDVFSTLTARNVQRNPSLKKTGAVIRWGIDDATAIERWENGIHLKEECISPIPLHLTQFAPATV
jgi:O-methyltransferase involved in polyketide biosynthesis